METLIDIFKKYDTDKDDLYKQIIEIMSEVLKTSDALK